MPARKSADRNEILRVYMETKSGAETARRLGLHQNTVLQILRSLRGQCRQCANDARVGAAYCDRCQEHLRERIKAKRKAKKRSGVCAQCSAPVAPPSRTYCAEHRLQNIDQGARTRSRRKTTGGIASNLQRERFLRSKYGQAAVDSWRDANGTCVVCGRHHSEQAVHIHHVDGDHQNRTRENLVCLCFDCHMLTERLLAHHRLADLFAWFTSRYPGRLPYAVASSFMPRSSRTGMIADEPDATVASARPMVYCVAPVEVDVIARPIVMVEPHRNAP